MDKFNTDTMLSSIIKTLPGIIFWKNGELVFQGCNLNFAKLAGLDSVDELIGKTDFDMCWKEFADKYRRDDLFVLKNNSVKFIEYNTNAQNQTNIVYIEKTPLINADTMKVQGVLGAGKVLNSFSAKIENLTLYDIVTSAIEPIILNSSMISEYFFSISKAESETLYLLIRGYSGAQTAEFLHRSPRTIQGHIDSLKDKTNTDTKNNMVYHAIKMGFMHIMPESLYLKARV